VDGFITPSAFIFLYESQLFLTFFNHNVSVWNFKGDLVAKFEDHILSTESNSNNISMNKYQDTIVSFCKDRNNLKQGSINISNIFTGKCISKITVENPNEENISEIDKIYRLKKEEALTEITALCYNEEQNEIYTGTKSGSIHAWSN